MTDDAWTLFTFFAGMCVGALIAILSFLIT